MTEKLLFQETRGGRRPNSGRKKGFIAEKTREYAAILHARGDNLLEVSVNYVKDLLAENERDKAFAAMIHLLPYLHPRLAAMAVQSTKTEKTLAELIEESFKPKLETVNSKVKTIESTPIYDNIDDLL